MFQAHDISESSHFAWRFYYQWNPALLFIFALLFFKVLFVVGYLDPSHTLFSSFPSHPFCPVLFFLCFCVVMPRASASACSSHPAAAQRRRPVSVVLRPPLTGGQATAAWVWCPVGKHPTWELVAYMHWRGFLCWILTPETPLKNTSWFDKKVINWCYNLKLVTNGFGTTSHKMSNKKKFSSILGLSHWK